MNTTSKIEFEKLLSTPREEKWKEAVEFRKANKDWLKISAEIALKVMDEMDKQGIKGNELAKRMDVSPQQVSKILKGREKMNLETISKLNNALGVKLITILQEDEIVVKKNELNSLKYLEEVVIRSNVKVSEVLKYSELLEHTYIDTSIGTKGNQKSLNFIQSKSFKSEQRFAIAS